MKMYSYILYIFEVTKVLNGEYSKSKNIKFLSGEISINLNEIGVDLNKIIVI